MHIFIQRHAEKIIAFLFGLAPLILLVAMTLFILEDRALYFTPSEVIRVITLAPFLGAIPYLVWKTYVKLRYL